MINRTLFLSLAALAVIGLSGCGSSSSDDSNVIEVERGKVYDALVTDAAGQIAVPEKGTNLYTFKSAPVYPVKASNGWIDVDGDGKLTTEDVKLDIPMVSYSDVITPVTSLIGDPSTEEGKAMVTQLKTELGVSESDLFKVPSKANEAVILLANAIYAEAEQGNVSSMGNVSLSDVSAKLQNYKDILSTYDTDGMSTKELAVEVEKYVVDNELSGYVDKYTTDEITSLEATQSTVDSEDATDQLDNNEISTNTSVTTAISAPTDGTELSGTLNEAVDGIMSTLWYKFNVQEGHLYEISVIDSTIDSSLTGIVEADLYVGPTIEDAAFAKTSIMYRSDYTEEIAVAVTESSINGKAGTFKLKIEDLGAIQ